MFEINGNTIRLTKGDSFYAIVSMTSPDGTAYTPVEGDTIRFAMKKNYYDITPLINRSIPVSTLILALDPADTSDLQIGTYVYDVEITYANGDVDTFISGQLTLLPEVM